MLRAILVAIIDAFFFIAIALSLLLDSLSHLDQLNGLALNLLNCNRKINLILILLLHFVICLLFIFLFICLLLLYIISL